MAINITNILSKQIVIGLSYFDINNTLLNQKQLTGMVSSADVETGITITLPDKSHFIIPSDLSAWFTAPQGHYFDQTHGVDVENPDYLITWDIYQKQKLVEDNTHQWWDWIPRTTPPGVNKPGDTKEQTL